jgi:hypothetical protein
MGFNIVDYKEALTDLDVNEASKWNNADGKDPYAYAVGDDAYDYAGGGALGCDVLHWANKKKREACYEQQKDARKESESDILYARAALLKAGKVDQAQMSPLAITGIIVGSLLAITVMVVVIKKVKANRG